MVWPFRFKDKQSSTPEQRDRRTWQMLQVEPALTCNLACVMCPWRREPGRTDVSGLMTKEVWAAVKAWLHEAGMLDFTGGGEPLLQPHLFEWIRDAADAGCRAGFLTNGSLLTTAMTDQLIDSGLDWIGFSMDGADAGVYESIRPGADFSKLCAAITDTARRKQNGRPQVILNFVMMPANAHQLSAMVGLAADLGVDRINFKQCDVIRAVNNDCAGLFAEHRDKRIRSLEKQLRKARGTAENVGIQTTAFAFSPDELPVCAQDPVHSLFIARNGSVAPCINTAYGGQSRFFQKSVVLPRLVFGRLPGQDLMDIWQSEPYMAFRNRISDREAAYRRVLGGSQFEPSLVKLKETFEDARQAMPPAADACRVCHYLYGV